jgi:3-hydroxypropanoate dehydrogenase
MAERTLSDEAQDVIFRDARTHKAWIDGEVTAALLERVYDLMKWGPTSANCCPARFVFVQSEEAKQRLKPHLDEGNVKQTMAAPVTVLIANDLKFYEKLPKLYPHDPSAISWFEGKEEKIKDTVFRNGTLQGAYFMIAARALGLDCGPMSGFNAKGVRDVFFTNQDVEVNFICNLGYVTHRNCIRAGRG